MQEAGIAALSIDDSINDEMRKIYQERRDTLVTGLVKAGLSVQSPKATFYVWIQVPKGKTSSSFSAELLNEVGIVTTPGNGFGETGEGYIRIALTVPKERLDEAIKRLGKIL